MFKNIPYIVNIMDKGFKFISGSFMIDARGSFLNGAGIKPAENENITEPKNFWTAEGYFPYVSSQAWRKWLRNTVIEEADWERSEIRILKKNKKGNVSQFATQCDPIKYPEDDLFGYMAAKSKSKKKTSEEEGEEEEDNEDNNNVSSVMRAAPFKSSILLSTEPVRTLPKDEAFVHLENGTPLPYSTEFYYNFLRANFSIDYERVGTIKDVGDRIEMEDVHIQQYLSAKKIVHDIEHGYYALADTNERKKRVGALLRALGVMRGGAKLAQFNTSVSPAAIILVGLSSGNLIFSRAFFSKNNKPSIDVEYVKQTLKEYNDRIVTPVYLGFMNGTFENESEIKDLEQIKLGTPREAIEGFISCLP